MVSSFLGSGLGLFITRGLADRHGGRFSCRSDMLGQGATFWFTIQ